MRNVIDGKESITDADRKAGQECREYLKGKLTMIALTKGKLTSFDQGLRNVIDKEEFNSTDRLSLGIIAYQPTAMNRYIRDEEIDAATRKSVMVSNDGDRVNLNITVLKTVYSNNFGKWYITASTDKDQIVFFPYNDLIEVGTTISISGTVKGFKNNQTKLNRVKVQN